jgi:hypothetical protein
MKDDFSTYNKFTEDKRLGGMANGLKIEGSGNIQWSFRASNGIFTIKSKCYHVPDSKVRLISPQRLFNAEEGINGRFIVDEHQAKLCFDKVGQLDIEYDSRSHLPVALGRNFDSGGAEANVSLLSDENQNLTPAQKLLLHWHHRFGHKGFAAIQRLFRTETPFKSEKFMRASRCTIPKCEICQYAKAHRKSTNGNVKAVNTKTDGVLKAGDLRPGATVSVDHFESRVKGRTAYSKDRLSSDQYVGGCVFVDHMSGYLHVEHQLGFSSSETIRAKQNYEQLAMNFGVLVDSYVADNGVFKANAFVTHIRDHNQKLSYCGVNAHHQNAIAERSIRTVSECARSMLLHASLHWKDQIQSNMWPLAISYAVHLYNHFPSDKGLCPADLFTGVTVPRHKLRDFHVWGAPVYVLDPKLQQGKKLPRWEPRTRRGIFVGLSPDHSSDVPLVLNLNTGHISPQFHVIFDDEFSTVPSLGSEEEPPPFWNIIDLDNHRLSVPVDPPDNTDSDNTLLHEEWLTPPELEERRRVTTRQGAIRDSFAADSVLDPSSAPTGLPISPPTSTPVIPPFESSSASQPLQRSTIKEPALPLSSMPSSPRRSPRLMESQSQLPTTRTKLPSTPSSSSPSPLASLPSPVRRSARLQQPRRSARLAANKCNTSYIDEVFLSSVTDTSRTHQETLLAYHAELQTDLDVGGYTGSDPRAYAAKHKLNDPDNPTYNEALSGKHATEYEQAMIKEIRQLIKQRTWSAIPRSEVPKTSKGERRPILKGTWAFKLKRLPDGSPLKFKARYCVRGDLQREGVDYFETYAPVVQWSTVRMLLTIILSRNWTTKQVDYTNAFAQAKLKEEVYIEPPKGFGRKDKKDMVLKLIQSLYGLKQAPKTFFEKLRDGLVERGFTQSTLDPCLFLKKDMICVVYVDDTIIAGPDADKIEELITSLGVAKEEQQHTFELRDEGQVGDFLGIRIERCAHNTFMLSQSGLINKVLKAAGMEDSNSAPTPAVTTPMHIDSEGAAFAEKWEYASIVGMLMYLATNSRPDIAYAVNQCARFTHCPRDSHATGVKRILRYLQGTKDKGMYLCPSGSLQVDCYVDADFAGLWKVEDEQDPVSVKSRSGHLIMFMGCPLLWQSKLQTQIALSTMEAEYIALSNSMRELIAVREILKQIVEKVFQNQSVNFNDASFKTIAKTFGNIPQSIVHEDNEACLKFSNMPKMSPRTKHIAIPYHFFRSKVEQLEIKVVGINTENQLADQFTKGLPQDKFIRDRRNLIGW